MRAIYNLLKFFIKCVMLFAIITLAAGFWALKVEPDLLVIKNIELYIPNWDEKLDGVKVAVLTDLHIGSNGIDLKKVQKIVRMTNSQNPDLIVLLGDFDTVTIKESKIAQKEIVKSFKDLKAQYGVISVLGNHDIKPPGVIRKMLQGAGITILENQITHINIEGKTVAVIGVRDWWHYNKEIKDFLGQLNITRPTLMLSHNPDIFPLVPENVSLTLSGHNHGGQVYLPLAGGLFLPSDYGQRFVKGHIAENNKHIFVSSGIGNCEYGPARLGNIPEIVILHLYAQKDNEEKIVNTEEKKGIENNLMSLYFAFIESEFYEKYFLPFYGRIK